MDDGSNALFVISPIEGYLWWTFPTEKQDSWWCR